MAIDGRVPVNFERPPVVEVACGIAFSLPKPLKTAHVGMFWSRVREQFPVAEEAMPLAMTVENTDGDVALQSVEVGFASVPPLRRTWLINKEGTHLIQLQDDRLLYNWKRTDSQPEYPSYVNVIAGFKDQWANFKSFLSENGLGEPTVRQLEMTYFNIVDHAQLPTLLVDHVPAGSGSRFLPEAEGINWQTHYRLPQTVGRLHVAITSARNSSTGEKVVRIDLTARGLPTQKDEASCYAWFDLAHEWITHGFADITSSDAQKKWGRIS